MRVLLTYLLLVIAMSTHAQDRERVLHGSKYKSRFVVAGRILQCDTLPLVHKAYPEGFKISPAHFISKKATDSLFRAYMHNRLKQDSLAEAKRKKEFATYVKAEVAKAKRLHKQIPVFAEPEHLQYAFLFDTRNVKRYRIKVTDIIKESPVNDSTGPEVKTIDTIIVLVVPTWRGDTTSNISNGKVVVYDAPYENDNNILDERYFTPEMLEFYKREHIYFITPGRIEQERWREVRVQY